VRGINTAPLPTLVSSPPSFLFTQLAPPLLSTLAFPISFSALFPALPHLGPPGWPRHSSDSYVQQNHPDCPPNCRPSTCSPLKSALSWPRYERCQLGQRSRFPTAFHHQSRAKCGQAALAIAVALRGRAKFTPRRTRRKGHMLLSGNCRPPHKLDQGVRLTLRDLALRSTHSDSGGGMSYMRIFSTGF
jgi:hypothetical protein